MNHVKTLALLSLLSGLLVGLSYLIYTRPLTLPNAFGKFSQFL